MTEQAMFGCIADDYTGAADLAGILARRGLRVIQCFGVPRDSSSFVDRRFDVVIVALKTRSVAKAEAISQSLKAAEWLQSIGVTHFYFKYCSTFDSTAHGNIGPVAEALMESQSCKATLFCPAFPENGRSVYLGHLFVNGVLLNESDMQNHPLTPMTDASLPRLLSAQSNRTVGLLPWTDITQGVSRTESVIARLRSDGKALLVIDTLCEQDMAIVSEVVCDWKLTTGGSAFAGHLVDRWIEKGRMHRGQESETPITTDSRAAVLSGSCSAATREQIAFFSSRFPAKKIDVVAASKDNHVLDELISWIDAHADAKSILLYTTAEPSELAKIQKSIGKDHAAMVAETVLAELANALVQRGVRRFVIAGGETSGAIVNRLGIQSVRIGSEIAPGVPWVYSMNEPTIALALKSGNFGGRSFFDDAVGNL